MTTFSNLATGAYTIAFNGPGNICVNCAPSGGGSFTDGRINNLDLAAPVVLYGRQYEDGGWGLEIYADDSSGRLFGISPETIAAVPECPETNTLIAADRARHIFFYRLSSCEFQLMAPTREGGKVYIIIFSDFNPNAGYHSHEE